MVVVTMTSGTARINNVVAVLKTVLAQSILPTKIFLNLSKEEFKDIKLPMELTELINSNPIIVLNWVDGPNTRSFKKIFPILKYLSAEDIIINIDDDMLLPKNFIKSRLADFKKYQTCISGLQSNELKRGYAKGLLPEVKHYLSAGSVYKKKMFNNGEKLLNKDIIATNHDDAFYNFITGLNGYTPENCSEMTAHELETLKEHETSIHGDIGCTGPFAATQINIARFISVYKANPKFNYFKTNKSVKEKNHGYNNCYLYF